MQYAGSRTSGSKRSTFERELERVRHQKDIVFQQIDVEHYQGPFAKHLWRREDLPPQVPIMRLFGVTMQQMSVVCHVHGFLPYLYIICPEGFNSSDVPQVYEELAKHIPMSAIAEIKIVRKGNIYGYGREKLMNFLKISTTSPNHLNAVKKLMEGGIALGRHPLRAYSTFESNMPIVLRFMVDTQITGMNWIELAAGKFYIRQGDQKVSTSQIECDVQYDTC